jgi:rubredoxin
MKRILTVVLLAFIAVYSVSPAFAADRGHAREKEGNHVHEAEYNHAHAECNHAHSESYLEFNRGHSEYGSGVFSLAVSALSAETIEAEIIRSDADNSVKIVWSDDDWTGTLNGASYKSGAWIRTEGSYLLVLKDAWGNSKTYTFSITHYYETVTVAPACSAKGYTRYTCKQCGGSYDADFVPMTGHQYIESAVSATCTQSGGIKHACTVCGYDYLTDVEYPSGHNYDGTVIQSATCTGTGELREVCEYCHDEVTTIVPATGHNYIITEVVKDGKNTKRKLQCTNCGDTYTENLGNQYEKVGSYMELIFNTYRPYMVSAFIGTAGVWSIFVGVSFIIAKKNEEKEKARRMLANYIIGLIAVFAILVACPYLIRGITALIT